MEEKIIKIVEWLAPGNPWLGFAFVILVTYVRAQMKELEGWLKRHDKDFKEMEENMIEGLKEEREFKYDQLRKHADLIYELGREISEIKGELKRRR